MEPEFSRKLRETYTNACSSAVAAMKLVRDDPETQSRPKLKEMFDNDITEFESSIEVYSNPDCFE